MATLSNNLELARYIALSANYNSKDELTNRKELLKFGRRLNVLDACHEAMDILNNADHTQLPKIDILLGIAIAKEIQGQDLDRDIAKFDEFWKRYEPKPDRSRRRPGAQREQAAANVEPDYVAILNEDFPEIPEQLDEIRAVEHARDVHVLQDIVISAPIEELPPLEFDDGLNEPMAETVETFEQIEPQRPMDTEAAIPMPEVPIPEISAVEEQIPVPVLPIARGRAIILPAVPGDDAPRRRRTRAEGEVPASAFNACDRDIQALEAIGEEYAPYNLFHCPVVSEVAGAEGDDSSTTDSGPNLILEDPSTLQRAEAVIEQLGMEVQHLELGQTVPEPTPEAVPMDTGFLPEQQEQPLEDTGTSVPDTEDFTKLVLVSDWRQRLLQMRDELRGRHLTLRDISPQPYTRYNITVAFMVVMKLLRDNEVKIYCNSKRYLSTIEFL